MNTVLFKRIKKIMCLLTSIRPRLLKAESLNCWFKHVNRILYTYIQFYLVETLIFINSIKDPIVFRPQVLDGGSIVLAIVAKDWIEQFILLVIPWPNWVYILVNQNEFLIMAAPLFLSTLLPILPIVVKG